LLRKNLEERSSLSPTFGKISFAEFYPNLRSNMAFTAAIFTNLIIPDGHGAEIFYT
jgi:hypothetical protein